MADVVTFGEGLLRLSPPHRQRLEQARELELWPAGSELNVAVGLVRLGTTSAWVSRLPDSPLGRLVASRARAEGVDLAHVEWAEDERLGLFFVEVGSPPRPTSAHYDRADSAFARLDPGSIDWAAILVGARAFHVSGITPALGDACARATADALAAARGEGCTTSYDVNLRRRLGSPERARELLEQFAPQLDVVLCSAEDAQALYGRSDGETLRDALGVELLILAEFDAGSRVWTAFGASRDSVASPLVEPVDPIGAGDAFCAGFLHGLLGAGVARGLAVGQALSAHKLSIPGDWALVVPGELELPVEARPLR